MMHSRPRSIQILLLILLVSCIVVRTDKDDGDPFEKFLLACSGGNMEVLESMLETHPAFATAHSQMGESCLHAASILGQTAATKAVLKAGGDPDARSTFAQGLRMTPLSWNVFGGHVENARVLLEAGADVNMDFDRMTKEGKEAVTVLDILYSYINTMVGEEDMEENPHHKIHFEMRNLVLQYGAKRYNDLVKEKREL